MKTRLDPTALQRPKLRNAVMVDTFRGQLRIRKWPRKRGKPKHPHTIWMNHIFKIDMRNLKLVDGLTTEWAYAAAKGTGLYPRDLMYASSTNGLFDIELADGRIIKPRRQGIYPVSFQGARLQLDADLAISAQTETAITWPIPVLNTADLFDPTEPTRINIPKGVNVVNFMGGIRSTISNNNRVVLLVRKNGTELMVYEDSGLNGWTAITVGSGALPVSEGDYYELVTWMQEARFLQGNSQSFFSCEILDADTPVP